MRTSVMACVLVVLACALGVGCSSSHTTEFGSEATFNKLTGNMETIVEADMDRTYAAAQGALEDMQFTIESKAKDVSKAIILSRMADKNRVQVTLDKRSQNVTGVTVGVASMTKEDTAREVLNKIVTRLKEGKTKAEDSK